MIKNPKPTLLASSVNCFLFAASVEEESVSDGTIESVCHCDSEFNE